MSMNRDGWEKSRLVILRHSDRSLGKKVTATLIANYCGVVLSDVPSSGWRAKMRDAGRNYALDCGEVVDGPEPLILGRARGLSR